MRFSEEDSRGPVIRDRRRIDPVTGRVRDAGSQGGQGQAGSPQRGQAQNKPGRHAVSKPGGGAGSSGAAGPGTPAGGAESPRADSAAAGGAASGGYPAGGPPASGGQGNGPAAGASGQAQASDAELTARLAERTADLQRLQAEYANYRKRVERDRMAVREQALANVLIELLPILDDIGRAREHEELTGGFKSVAESLESATVKLGLTRYAEDGDPFDPTLHEALMHSYSPDVTETTCVRILQPGYKVGDRILRPARVAVAEPGEPEDPDGTGNQTSEGGGDDAHDHEQASGEAPSGGGAEAPHDGAPHHGAPRAGGIG